MENIIVVFIAVVMIVAILSVAIIRGRNDSQTIKRLNEDIESTRAHSMRAMETAARAEADNQATKARLEELRTELVESKEALDIAQRSLANAEKSAALERQSREEIQKRMNDWEKVQNEHMKHAQAAVAKTANDVSSKLLTDHKRESEAAKKESEERIKKSTAELSKNFLNVTKTLASLNDQVTENRQTVDTVWKALSSPGGAGYYSQIGLENTLKNFGLERGRDFNMEHSFDDAQESKRLRPDAVVFLPSESVLVIDSKASKFLLELAEAEGTEEEERQAYSNLASTMNQHLKALGSKDYRGAIVSSYRESGRETEIRRIISVMYLPNEGALEKLKRADPEFDRKAAKEQIILAGPTGLSAIIGFARAEIDLGRQAENQEKIIDGTQQLLESIAVVVGHVDSVGKGLKSASNSLAKLTGSINQRLLPRTRGLAALGVSPIRNRQIPSKIPMYQLIDHSQNGVIDAEAEDVTVPDLLKSLANGR
jgi:DNA recombination protein RmuC